MKPAIPLELAWKQERKWFSRTLISSLVSILCFIAMVGTLAWSKKEALRVASSMGGSPSTYTEQQAQDFLAAMGATMTVVYVTVVLFFVSGLILLTFLVRWLVAVRTRRKAMAGRCGRSPVPEH